MIDRMGDKASAKSTMIEAGVPCVPGSVDFRVI
jgi:acetyl-CoA carboxylase biotin carboxylase subunit